MRNHCVLASPRTAPEDLLRELRVLDPLYDIHYVGNGAWVVGRVVPNSARIESAGKIHYRRDRVDGRGVRKFSQIALPALAMQGFGIVAMFENLVGEPDTRILTEVRAKEWLYRNRADKEFEERLDRSEGIQEITGVPRSMKQDEWWDEIAYRDRHVRPILFRGQKHFGQGNLHAG